VLPGILAVGAIAAVVLLLIGIFGRTPDPSTAVPGGSTASGSPQATPAPGTSPPTTPPVATTPVVPVVTTPVIPDIPVVVLNSTDTSLLAARVTEYLSGLGWAMEPPDNFAPVLEETTVYYPEGEEAAALLLAATVPGDADTVAPAIPEVASDVLTVVLGEDAIDWLAPGETSPPPST